MSFDHVLGQPTVVAALRGALERGAVHHAYRFEGPDGVGKKLAAMAFAQALVCGDSSTTRTGCGRCGACRRAVTLSDESPQVPLHPDVIFVKRGLYPELLGKSEAKSISIQQIRTIVLARFSFPPHEGRARVFIVHDAEQLGDHAANALLKMLEEPRPGTYFVLLTAAPERLLDTIRSRSLPLRFGPLPDEVIARLLRERGVDERRIPDLCQLAGGSAALAIEAADPELGERRSRFVQSVLDALRARDLGDALALGDAADRDRRVLAADLQALGQSFVREARASVRADPFRAEIAARRHSLVLDAIDVVDRNGAAALCLASLVASLRHARQRRPGTPPPIVVTRR